MLPLLQAEVVPPAGSTRVLSGATRGAGLPGPLFTWRHFSRSMNERLRWLGGMICLLAIFAHLTAVAGALPFWERPRRQCPSQAVLSHHAAVVGLLLAALSQTVWVERNSRAARFAWPVSRGRPSVLEAAAVAGRGGQRCRGRVIEWASVRSDMAGKDLGDGLTKGH